MPFLYCRYWNQPAKVKGRPQALVSALRRVFPSGLDTLVPTSLDQVLSQSASLTTSAEAPQLGGAIEADDADVAGRIEAVTGAAEVLQEHTVEVLPHTAIAAGAVESGQTGSRDDALAASAEEEGATRRIQRPALSMDALPASTSRPERSVAEPSEAGAASHADKAHGHDSQLHVLTGKQSCSGATNMDGLGQSAGALGISEQAKNGFPQKVSWEARDDNSFATRSRQLSPDWTIAANLQSRPTRPYSAGALGMHSMTANLRASQRCS